MNGTRCKTVEREIGEIFEEDGKKLQVVKDNQDDLDMPENVRECDNYTMK